MCTTSVHINPLNSENYDVWKTQMKAILIKNDLWSYVDGTNKCLGTEAEKNLWVKQDQKACADITLSVSAAELRQISECTTSHEMWETLKRTHQSMGPAKKSTLLKRIALAHMKEGDNIREHTNDFFDAVKKLKEIGLTIGDELLSILLLYSLPQSYDNFRCALETRDDIPKPEILHIKILEESESRKANVDRSEQNALFARKDKSFSKLNFQKKPFSEKRDVTCNKCGKNGHFSKYCRGKKPNNYSNGHKEKTSNKKHDTVLYSTESSFFSKDVNDKWCLDSGCTSHMNSNVENFVEIEMKNKILHLANDKTATIKGVGMVKLPEDNVKLTDVLYVSDLRTNLLSVSKITDKGYKVIFQKNDAKIIDNEGNTILYAERVGNLYFLKEKESAAMVKEGEISNIDLWHQKMGHLNGQDLYHMIKNKLAYGLNKTKDVKLSPCEICISEKQVQEHFSKSTRKTKELLEIVHSDVCGPFNVNSLSGGRYFLTFIDDKSRWCVLYILKHKSEVFEIFKKYKATVELKTGKKIKALQTDNGKEFCNKEFDLFLEKYGIVRRLTTPYTPQQNGVAERKNRTLVEMARCMLKQAGAPPSFWAEAINTACYIRNHCPTKALEGEIPYKSWTGQTPTLSHFKIFGTKAYVLNKAHKNKLESRSEQCIFVGYSLESKAYRLWCPRKRNIIISRDVKFLRESGFNNQYTKFDHVDTMREFEITENVDIMNNNEVEHSDETIHENDGEIEMTNYEMDHNDNINIHENDVNTIDGEIETLNDSNITMGNNQDTGTARRGRGRPRIIRNGLPGRPKKQYQPPTLHNEVTNHDNEVDGYTTCVESEMQTDNEIESANVASTDDPISLSEALKSNNAAQWKKAIENELMAQLKNETWEFVPRPVNRKTIGNRFVFATKSNGTKKARLVAKGCAQRPGIDFDETYSPVVRSTSVRLLAALAAEKRMEIHQMDVVTAYLNGELKESVYMEIPDYLRIFLNDFVLTNSKIAENAKLVNRAKKWLDDLNQSQDNVCLLKKALYGLRQSGLRWYEKLRTKLLAAGLRATKQDPCLFVDHRDDKTMLVTIYVDDLLIASNDKDWIVWLKKTLSKSFDMKDMGTVKACLGIQFTQNLDKNFVSLSQANYIQKILKRFGMTECKSARTPIEVNCKLSRPPIPDENEMVKYPYQKLIGSLMYLAVYTRPDIAFAVNFLSQFNSNYKEEHWKAAKRVLRYLNGTQNYILRYIKTGSPLYAVADADWAADSYDRRSYSGFGFILSGAVISWEARKQKTVALSSTESEYMAISEATKEALYLKAILSEIGVECGQITIFNDNQSAQKLIQGFGYNSRTKHIDVRHHFVREKYQDGSIDLKYMSTDEMPADILTKGLSMNKHFNCASSLGLNIEQYS